MNKNLEKYQGEFKCGKRHGKGIFTNDNDEVFDGIWEDDQFIQGSFIDINKTEYQGKFKNWLIEG